MAWTRYQICLSLLLVISGSVNTLIMKWADGLESYSSDGVLRRFHHPFFQVLLLLSGECLCFIAFKVLYQILSKRGDGSENEHHLTKGSREFNSLRLFIPAMCDMASTAIVFIGLSLTSASSFQMLRGALIVFVGILTRTCLGRVLKKREWLGIFFVIMGLVIIGLADFINKGPNEETQETHNVIIGDILIVVAQILTATQMIIEEKYVSDLQIPPLEAVGWEGVYGFVVSSLLLIPLYFIKVGPPFSDNSTGALENVIDAFFQISNNFELMIAVVGGTISFGAFNFAGVSVTKEFSATTRTVFDSIRTIVIWIISLIFMGEIFHWLQFVGFTVQLLGMCLYSNVACSFCKSKSTKRNELL